MTLSYLPEIISILGKPYYQNEWGLIYNMDCSDALLLLTNNIWFNSSITSPPYNIGKDYEKALSIEEYIDWLSKIIDSIYNLTEASGNLLLNLGYLKLEEKARAIPIPYLLWDKIKFFLNQEIVWNYGAGVACKNYLSPRNEKILWYVKNSEKYTFNLDSIRDPDVKYPNSKRKGKLRTNILGKNPSDVWQIAKVTSGQDRSSAERTTHPAQYPEDLVERMILGFTNPFDLILDPFLGSGTTALVAMKHQRYCIGFEINSSYCKIASERIEKFKMIYDYQTQTLF